MLSTNKYYSSSGLGYLASAGQAKNTLTAAETDGKITKAEFINARPANVTREEAAAQFVALDTKKGAFVKRSEIIAALKKNAPAPAVAAKLSDTALATLLQAVTAKAQQANS